MGSGGATTRASSTWGISYGYDTRQHHTGNDYDTCVAATATMPCPHVVLATCSSTCACTTCARGMVAVAARLVVGCVLLLLCLRPARSLPHCRPHSPAHALPPAPPTLTRARTTPLRLHVRPSPLPNPDSQQCRIPVSAAWCCCAVPCCAVPCHAVLLLLYCAVLCFVALCVPRAHMCVRACIGACGPAAACSSTCCCHRPSYLPLSPAHLTALLPPPPAPPPMTPLDALRINTKHCIPHF